MIQVYHNSRCGKSRQAIQFLEDAGKEFEIIKYLEAPPTFEQLVILLQKLKLKPLDLIRQKETIWIDQFKGKNGSDEEIINAMVQNPILIERPILIRDNLAIVARSPDQLNDFI
jgi:arsenate reductase